MASIPDSSNTGNTTNSLLEAGLNALKQGQYADAIAALESIVQSQANEPPGLRAQMGLVVAYEKVGEPAKAIALCQSLSQCGNSQMQEWADRNLATLTKRYPQPGAEPEVDQTGFVPLANPSQSGVRETARQVATPPTNIIQSSASAVQKDEVADIQVTQSSMAAQPEAEFVDARAGSRSSTPLPESTNPQTALEPSATEPEPGYQPQWRQAGRAKYWNPLGKVKLYRLWLLQGGTIAALFFVIWAVLKLVTTKINEALFYTKDFLRPIQLFYLDPAPPILIIFAILLVTSPWLLDGWFKMFFGLQPLPTSRLSEYSPEAVRLLPRLCQSRKISLPKLEIIPISEPVSLTYGCLPRFARVVVSQGLLDSLTDDEIAAIYIYEMGHIVCRDFIALSLITTILLIPYTIYWQFSVWGDNLQHRSNTYTNQFLKFFYGLSASVLSIVSALAYGAYWLCRLPVLWLSRHRTYYSDRFAAEVTGNPNALTRALLKIAIGTAENVQNQAQTSYLLEGLDILTPLGHRMASSLGSLYGYTPLASILQWDYSNPYRQWLAVNNSHPPTGDRLQLLTRYARHWKIEPELELTLVPKQRLNADQWQTLLLQGAPFFGVVVGAIVALIFWLVGGIAGKFGIERIAWIWGDRVLLFSWMLLGFGIGTILRFNSLFPDMPTSLQRPPANLNSPRLPVLLKNPTAIPLNSQPIYIEGKLLGRRGMGNWLGQDLILQTETGLIKLHYLSQLGPLGNLLPTPMRPCQLINQPITVTGWFRRGVTPWIDVDVIRTRGGRTVRGGHQVWSTVAFLAAIAVALTMILSSGG
jgi:Zn-dependent protease with chaperone function